MVAEMVCGMHQIFDVGTEAGRGELTLGLPRPVKSNRSTAIPCAAKAREIRPAAALSLPQVKQWANSAQAFGSPIGISNLPVNSPLLPRKTVRAEVLMCLPRLRTIASEMYYTEQFVPGMATRQKALGQNAADCH